MELDQHNSDDAFIFRKKPTNSRCLCITSLVVGIAAFVIGILIGRFATCPDEEPFVMNGAYLPGVAEDIMDDEVPGIDEEIMNMIKSENIRENLRMLSSKPHLAGTKENNDLAHHLKTLWDEAGLDHVTLTPYDILLSYPNMSDLNYVELLDGAGASQYKSPLTEPILTPEENKTGVVPPFNAYSAPGDITGDLVYVNYGRVEDYVHLETNTAVNVSGKIVIARYGKIFRGDKVHQAELRGAIGVILYSDPEDYTSGDTDQVYPKDWWLPPSGTQRGTLYTGDGDPLTAGYPAISSAYRKIDPTFFLPSVPVHPISYGIAQHLLRQLAGDEVPEEWRGGLNLTYKYGATFVNPEWKVHIKVTTQNSRRMVYNTVGIIRGKTEPDRYVLIGNHRDGWVFGALDPSSGTAVMMEMARVMGSLVKTGKWRPRRSILFCSWGAEEYGLLGSTEWVEHYTKTLGARAVAYLNVDIAIQGNFSLRALGTPLIHRTLYEATKKVPNPNQTEVAAGRTTVYDTWLLAKPWEQYGIPEVTLPGAGSDYTPFRDRIGIPVVDIRYTWDSKSMSLSSYPLYHSAYETFYVVDNIMDKGFKYHTAVGQVWAEMARHLADTLILPFNVSDYSFVMKNLADTLLDRFGTMMEEKQINTGSLTEAIANFTDGVHLFERSLGKINRNNPFAVRQVNDQLMNVERAFLDPLGLPGRRLKRHVLLTESSVDNYAGSSFPGLSDALAEIQLGHDVDNKWETVRQHFSVVLFTIQSATSTLRDVTDFMYDYM